MSFGVVGFYDHEGRQDPHRPPTEGGHYGVHMRQLTGQMHHANELRIGCACTQAMLQTASCGSCRQQLHTVAQRESRTMISSHICMPVFQPNCYMHLICKKESMAAGNRYRHRMCLQDTLLGSAYMVDLLISIENSGLSDLRHMSTSWSYKQSLYVHNLSQCTHGIACLSVLLQTGCLVGHAVPCVRGCAHTELAHRTKCAAQLPLHPTWGGPSKHWLS